MKCSPNELQIIMARSSLHYQIRVKKNPYFLSETRHDSFTAIKRTNLKEENTSLSLRSLRQQIQTQNSPPQPRVKSEELGITESRPLKSVAREKWGTHDALRAQ